MNPTTHFGSCFEYAAVGDHPQQRRCFFREPSRERSGKCIDDQGYRYVTALRPRSFCNALDANSRAEKTCSCAVAGPSRVSRFN